MLLVCGISLLLIALIAVSLRSRVASASAPAGDFDIYSLSCRYRPMLRLLDGSDFQLLSDSGDPVLARRMRSQRRAIFRGYLRSLGKDHVRLCARIRELMTESNEDQRELGKMLVRMQMNFRFLTAGVYVRLALHAAGVGNVAVWNLMESFEQLRLKAEMLSATVPSSAQTSVA